MKEFIPEGDAVLCEPVPDKPAPEGGFIYENTDRLPMYRILKVGSAVQGLKLEPGDVVVCNSVGNKFRSDGRTYHIFQSENIIGRLRHEQR